MLAGERVRHLECFFKIARFDNPAPVRERLCDNRPSWQALDLFVNLTIDRFGEGVVGSDQQRARQRIVLSLREQIRGHPGRIGRIVCDDQTLCRAGQGLDAHLAENHAFRQHDEQIPGTNDLVDARQRLSAIGQPGDGLGAPDAIDGIHCCHARGGEQDVRDIPVRP